MSNFWVDIYTAAGVKTNASTTAISGVRRTDRINQIGVIEFSVPAYVAAQIGSAKGLRYRVYHSTQGYLGEYIHNDISIDANQKTAGIVAHDSLLQLSNTIVGFGRAFNNQTIAAALSSLLGDIGWTVTYESGFDSSQPVTLEFQGETHLRAIDALRQYERGFFRRAGDTSILFGAFNSTTPVTTLRQATAANMEGLPLITTLKRERRGSGVANRIFATGSGLGATQLDLRYSNRTTPYTIQTATIGGNPAYYIEDAASIAQFGLQSRVVNFNQIRPITNSAADLQNAGNALYDIATAYLQRFRNEQDVYSVRVFNLPASVAPGDLVRLQYSGVAETESSRVAWLSVDQNFFVTQITRSFEGNGEPVADLTLSASGEDIVGTTEVITTLLEDVSRFKTRPQPSMSLYSKASQTMPIDSTRTFDFTFYIGSEVLALNAMTLEFTLGPLRTYAANSTDSGGGSTQTSSSGGSSTQTSTSGGSSTPTSSSPVESTLHLHTIPFQNGTLGNAVYLYNGQLYTIGGGSTSSNSNGVIHTHTVTLPSHTHDVTVPNHTHNVTIPNHTHPLTFGVSDDSQNPTNVTITVNGTAVGSIRNAATGTFVGSSASGPGVFTVDILAALTATDFRQRTHTIRFTCGSNRGLVFAQLLGRVTIQPIAV